MATPFNETPKWFDADFYLEAKLALLIAADPKGNWTRPSLVEAFKAAGIDNPYDHYLAYGDMEGLSPNPLFNNTEYLAAKTAAMGSTWTTEMVAKAIADAGLTLMQHYEKYGSVYENLSPSSAFNQNKYYEAKLEQVQTAEPDKGWTLDTLKAAFAAAGLTPLDHYLAYAKMEGLADYDYSDNGAPIPHPGNKLALTKGADTATPDAEDATMKTSAKDDAISAIAGNSTTGTLTAGDVIDGGDGVDILTVDMQANYTFKSGSIKNVEKIVLNNKGGYTFDAKGVEAADLYTVNGGDKNVVIKNVDSTETGYALTQADGKFDVLIDDTALKGKADNVNITLNGVGTVSTDDTTDDAKEVTLNVTGTSSKGVVEGVTLLAAQDTDNLVILAKGHETVGVMGAGNVDVTVASGLKTFDASAATGEVIADLFKASSTLKTITGGAGDDSITVGVAALAGTVFTGGAGDDTLTFNENPTATAKTTISGFEKIVLEKGGTLNGTNITDVAEIQVGASGGIITKLANTDLILSSESAAVAATSYDGKGNLTFQNVDTDGALDAATVANLTANSVETLTITNGDTEGSGDVITFGELNAKLATSLTVNTGEFGVTLSKGDLHSVDTITVAGNGNFDFTVDASAKLKSLTTIDASGQNGAFKFDATKYTTELGTADAPLSITGSTVEDNTVVLTAGKDFVTFTGGNGSNLITGGKGADVITLNGSQDTIKYVANATADIVAEISGGADTINGFDGSSDVIQFNGAWLGLATDAAGAAVITDLGIGGEGATVMAATGVVNKIHLTFTVGANAENSAHVADALGSVSVGGDSGSSIFAIDDGSDTYLWYLVNDGTSGISASELKLVGILDSFTEIGDGDVMLGV